MVITLDFESSDPSSNLGGTSEAFLLLYFIFNLKFRRYIQNVKWQNKLNFHSMQMFLPFHWLRAHHVTCK